MNAMDITCQNPSSFARFVRKSVMLIVLLFAFAAGASAQRYYVMYYEEGGNKHYLAISNDGNSLTNETELSLRCYWVADGDFYTALDVYKDKRQTPSTPVNTYNESSRKALKSVAFPKKYLVQNSSHEDKQYKTGLDLQLGTSAQIRWMMDNDDEDTPILYYYYYKHYVYYDKKWQYSTIGDKQTSKVKIEVYSVFPPQISIVQNGSSYQMTMSAQNGCKIYYTTDGSTPTTSSVVYGGTQLTPNKGTTIKAIAYDPITKITSSVAELILPESMTVTLDDREDHGWTYYKGVDDNYDTNYAGKLYSPDPRDVKIIYMANGGAVSISEPENEFVYFKTLEQGESKGQYPYTVISNPFSKRPTKKGFGGWKIVSGGNYIQGHNDNDVLSLDEDIVFVNLNKNGLSEIKFEATWVNAHITYLTSLTGILNEETKKYTNDYTYSKEEGTYETNFLVLNCNPTSITLTSPCTIVMVEPDGSVDYRGTYTFTGSIVPYDNTSNEGNGNSKIEYTHWNPIANIDAKGRNFTIGRGMRMNGGIHLYGTNQLAPVNQILKVESGKFNQFRHYANDAETEYKKNDIVKQWVTHGCDYDRAKGDNNKLEFTHRMYVGYKCSLNLSPNQEMCRVYGLSGKFMTQVSKGSADWEQCYYMSVSDAYNKGYRYMEIQGGEWLSITGGTDYYDPSSGLRDYEKEIPSFTFRMRGGHVKGSIYGAAAFYDAAGTRTFIITGGTINGWIAGGANGTREYGGHLYGASYVYVGGNVIVDSKALDNSNPNVVINRAVGGNVFGAGCGYSAISTSGQVTEGTNVVIADNAYVERGVYGGGSYGYCATDKTSNIYITGGTIDGVDGGVNGTSYVATIRGGVFGGACQNMGGHVNIYMTGGTVYGGIYGGSNESGTLIGNVNMKITGGNIGSSTTKANIHGGGYGSATAVNGNVSLALGRNGATEGATVHGDVYGGSALGSVNNASSDKTEVTLNSGTINGNLYGGGLGDDNNEAFVNGEVTVTTNGGRIAGAVYGCNNVYGAPQSTVTINMNGGDVNYVYGGGNLAAYTYNGNYPKVNIQRGTIRHAIYGGGLGESAIVTGNPQVVMTGGTVGYTIDGNEVVDGDIFGGGNAAAVNGNTSVTITGGEVKRNVYGGGNQAAVSGTTNVVIGKGT